MKQSFRQGIIVIAMLALFSLVVKPIYAGFKISDEMKSCIVAIGSIQYKLDEGTGIIKETKIFRGTGVLVNAERYILVTAKHVIFDEESKLLIPNLCYWGNKKNGKEFINSFAQTKYEYPNITWVVHESSDIDIALSVVAKSDDNEMFFVGLDIFENTANIEKGDDVVYLGFPGGLGAGFGTNPVLRKGMVALNEKGKKFFYIDAVVSAGNSGGPVFKIIKDKEKDLAEAKLAGIISRFPYMRKKVGVFHTGLGVVFSSDCIKDILKSEAFKKTL